MADRSKIADGIKTLIITVGMMFAAPFTIYEAFKNQEHPLYIPVLILGIILAILAIVFGFKGIKKVTDGFFD